MELSLIWWLLIDIIVKKTEFTVSLCASNYIAPCPAGSTILLHFHLTVSLRAPDYIALCPAYITYMLNGHPVPCYEMLCMEPPKFISLCGELRERSLMKEYSGYCCWGISCYFCFYCWTLPRAADSVRSLLTLHRDNKPAL